MTLEELKEKLRELSVDGVGPEADHAAADSLLLQYIDDPEVTEIYNSLDKWYA